MSHTRHGHIDGEIDDELIKARGRVIAIQRSMVIVTAALVIGLLMLNAFDTYQGIKARNELLSCTIPGGQCYNRAQEQTAEAIRSINRGNLRIEEKTRVIIILAIDCAKDQGDSSTVSSIQRCVERGLEDGLGDAASR